MKRSCWLVFEKDWIFLNAFEAWRVFPPKFEKLVKFKIFVFSLGDKIK